MPTIHEEKNHKQDFRFPSFPRRRESSNPLKKLDTRIRGYDEFKGLAKVLIKFEYILYPWQKTPPGSPAVTADQ